MKKIVFATIVVLFTVIISSCTQQTEMKFSVDVSRQFYVNNFKKDIGTAD